MNADSFNRIIPSGNTNILTYDDIKTRAFDSVCIGTYCGKNLKFFNNVFIGKEAGLNATEVENSILLGAKAGANLVNGNKNIIIGYNYCGDTTSNLINIGDNYTSSTSTTIGYYNENIGISNIIIGYYSSNLGANLYTIGNNLIVKSQSIFYHNGLPDPTLKNLTYFIDNYSNIYSNVYNSIDNDSSFIITSNIEIQRKNLISDFIIPFLNKKDSYIIQGKTIFINNNYDSNINNYQLNIFNYNINSNILLNESYNLTNTQTSVTISTTIIRRIAPPILDIITKNISFNPLDGIILNRNEYQIKFFITIPPIYGSFKNNLVNSLILDRNNLIYIGNVNILNYITDYCYVVPLLFYENDIIVGNEVRFTFNRNFEYINLTPDDPISINWDKELVLKSLTINCDVISFDYIYLKSKIIENLDFTNLNDLDISKVLINFVENPIYGFISDSNRNPVSSVNIQELDKIIYQNYDNKYNLDSFKINYSYGYYYANKNLVTVNLNIITVNQIKLKNQFIYDNFDIKNNIISTSLPSFIINYSSSSNITPINDYYNYHLAKLDGSKFKSLNLRLAVMNTPKLLFNNPNFYNFFGSISYDIYYNTIISSNQIFNYPNDYQYLRYDINEGTITNDTTISFLVSPNVQYPYSFIKNKYEFNLGLYQNENKIINFNYSNFDFNSYTKVINLITNDDLNNVNNLRLEYYLSSNIHNDELIVNNLCEIHFKDLTISKTNYDINNFNITQGKDITVQGINNIAIGSNFSIIGNNSIVIGADNSKGPIFESIVIGKKNCSNTSINTSINNSIIIGNNNTSEVIGNISQIIIGNDINNRYLLNIGNLLARDNDKIYLGLSAQPIVIGYDSNDVIDLSDNSSVYIKNGLSASDISIKNSNNYSIKLKVSENLENDISYTFPEIPSEISRIMMSSDSNGNLKWIETDIFNTNKDINVNNIITSNITVKGYIIGDGSLLSNVNISDKTTNDLREGTKNLYFTKERTSNIIKIVINEINSDYIREGTNNLYYTPERDSNSFKFNFSNVTTDNLKEGTSNLYYNSNYLLNAILFNFGKFTTDNLKEGTSNLYLNNTNINKFINERTTDNFNEGSSNLFFTSQRANNYINNYFLNITTDNIKEGNSNLFYNNIRINSNINSYFYSNISTDNIKEGLSNLYLTSNNAEPIVLDIINKYTTTDNIKEGAINLYLTPERFNSFIKSKTTDDINEGNTNIYFTSNRVLSVLNNINSDSIIQGKRNLYYSENLAKSYLSKSLSLIDSDLIKEGTSNKYIVNNTYNSNLTVNATIRASNVIIQDRNLIDIYNETVYNIQNNYSKSFSNITSANNISIFNTSNQPFRLNLNIQSNQSLSFANGACPFIIVNCNVGINILNPSYNLHVNGTAYANNFYGDGYNLTNLNFNNITNLSADTIPNGNKNKFIVNNIYNNNLTITGDLIYNNSIIKGNIIPANDGIYSIGDDNSFLKNISTKELSLGSILNENSNLKVNFSNNQLTFSINNNSNLSNLIDFRYLYNVPDFSVGGSGNVSLSNIFVSSASENPLVIKNEYSNLFIITNNGSVGIGLNIPNSNFKLDIQGDINCSNIYTSNINVYEALNTTSTVLKNFINITNNNFLSSININSNTNYYTATVLKNFINITNSNILNILDFTSVNLLTNLTNSNTYLNNKINSNISNIINNFNTSNSNLNNFII